MCRQVALVSKRNRERLNKLLAKNQLKKRASVMIARWASEGVSVSPVADDRYGTLLGKLRDGRSGPVEWTGDLLVELRNISAGADILTVLGWNVDQEPALLISAEKLLANASALSRVYPDGFVLISEVAGKALLVDFDDQEGTLITSIDLAPRTA